jgi:hypothetical protein
MREFEYEVKNSYERSHTLHYDYSTFLFMINAVYHSTIDKEITLGAPLEKQPRYSTGAQRASSSLFGSFLALRRGKE